MFTRLPPPISLEVRSAIGSGNSTLVVLMACVGAFRQCADPRAEILLDAADDIEKRLTLFPGHNGNGALERGGQGGGVVDTLAIAARRDANLLECREAIETREGRVIAFRGAAIGIHRGREVAYRVPHRVVHDHEENRQIM